jgi:hypothetical protein
VRKRYQIIGAIIQFPANVTFWLTDPKSLMIILMSLVMAVGAACMIMWLPQNFVYHPMYSIIKKYLKIFWFLVLFFSASRFTSRYFVTVRWFLLLSSLITEYVFQNLQFKSAHDYPGDETMALYVFVGVMIVSIISYIYISRKALKYML